MKKTLKGIIVALAFMLPCGVFADPTPTPQTPPTRNAPTAKTGTQLGTTPIAPATLLLLGLGGAAVGATVIRNIKKGGE